MIHDPPDIDSPVVSFAFAAFVIIVFVVAVVVPFVRAFRRRWAELEQEERKRKVIAFCRDRGFEPHEDDIEMVLKVKRR